MKEHSGTKPVRNTGSIEPKYEWNSQQPSVLVFDVNETLIDFESMNELFARVYGEPAGPS